MPEPIDMKEDSVSGGTALALPRPGSGRLSKQPLILEAATNLFATKPYREVLVDDVAREAGVGKGTVYRYFKDKEDLFFSCLITALDAAYDCIHGLRHEKHIPYSDRLGKTIERLAEFYAQNQRLLHIMHHHASLHSEERHQAMHDRWQKLRRVITRLIEKGIDAGEFRKVDGHSAAIALHSALRSLAHDGDDPGRIAPTLKTLFINGLSNKGD
jgi:AcrR family transcriptional regulator